jgi:hypothetical protein
MSLIRLHWGEYDWLRMKRLNSKSRYQFISLFHELLYFFIISFMLFPLCVKRIILCFVYSKNHHPSCIYPPLEEEYMHATYIVDVDSVSIPQAIHKDDHCIHISLESDQPCNYTEVRTNSNPVHNSAPCGITVEPCHQHVSSHNQPTAFQIKIRLNMFKPLRLPYLLNPYPLECYGYPPQFSGENQVSAERHLESFEDFVELFEIVHEDVIMIFFSKSLIRDVVAWFKGLRVDSIGSWIEFSNVFLKYWSECKSLDSYHVDFYALKRKQGEALPVFNRRFYGSCWHRGRPRVQRSRACTNKTLTTDPFGNTCEADEVSPEVEAGVVARLRCLQP